MRVLLLLVAYLTLHPSMGAAQSRPLSPTASALFISGARGPLYRAGLREATDTVRREISPTYWREGALIGSAVGALGGLLVGQFICEQSEGQGESCMTTRVTAVLASALLLALPGALIGGQFSKGEPNVLSDSD
jgi:hypothetical protein